jgi:aminoglycoside phosphotransferase (APT) family kinase protein
MDPSDAKGPGSSAPEGLDLEAVAGWLAAYVPEAKLPIQAELIAGGRSNLTYRIDDSAGHSYALRRPPLGHVLPTAHDMAREYRVITALGPTPVPVPRSLALCQDDSVNGAPFYLMDYVDGLIIRDEETCRRLMDTATRERAGWSLVETLASIHDVDIDAVGLGDFGRREGYIERQLRRWITQYRGSVATVLECPAEPVAGGAADAEGASPTEVTDRAATTSPGDIVEEVHDRLADAIMPEGPATIVHGDFRLDNTVLAPDGSVRAVLDWEISTLGDPLADLGLLMVYWAEPGEEASLTGVSPTVLPGFPSRSALVSRYESLTGRDVSGLAYYVAFGYWKLACILQGVHARYAAGAAAGDRSSVEGFAQQVQRLAQAAASALDEL